MILDDSIDRDKFPMSLDSLVKNEVFPTSVAADCDKVVHVMELSLNCMLSMNFELAGTSLLMNALPPLTTTFSSDAFSCGDGK